ncbi:hypothetical protein ZIOFF_010115 [Zingiber officinale]|uniref:Uncharacterized protein n=1 Tax=Zingiber officinale TaxID=94328 RepID=A0A8J5HGK0_ZINOF|nr:hypothetical protein ZIOFF_010115 [Zingiber officinale]
MVSAQLWDWSRMEGLEVFNTWRSLSRHPKPHRIPLICSHGLSFEDGGRSPFHGFHSALEVIPGKPGFSLQPPPPSSVSKSNAFPTMFQGVHDPNEEKVVKSLRDTLLSKGQLPEKYDDYHTLLRSKQDGPVVLGWRHPWEGHGDHSHDHVPEDKDVIEKVDWILFGSKKKPQRQVSAPSASKTKSAETVGNDSPGTNEEKEENVKVDDASSPRARKSRRRPEVASSSNFVRCSQYRYALRC